MSHTPLSLSTAVKSWSPCGSSTINRKARVKNATAACNRCRQMKVRCDGDFPCSECVRRKCDCVRKSTDSRVTREPIIESFGQATELMQSYWRFYYLDVYLKHEHVHSFLPMLRVRNEFLSTERALEQSPAGRFEEYVALAIACRSLGHLEVFQGAFTEARALASRLASWATSESCVVGIFLLGITQLPEDKGLGIGFLDLAHQIVRRLVPSPQLRILDEMLQALHFVRSPRNLPSSTQLSVPVAFPMYGDGHERITRNFFLTHPMTTQLITELRRFPIHSAVLDLFAQMHFCERLSLTDRSNVPASTDCAEMMLECTVLGDKAMLEEAPFVEPTRIRHLIALRLLVSCGLRMLICTAGGLVRLGSAYARHTLDILQAVCATPMAGFNTDSINMAAFGLAAFFTVFKEPTNAPGVLWSSMLLELCDTLRPVAHFRVLGELIQAAHQSLGSEDTEPLTIPVPDQEDITARWLAPERAPLDLEAVLQSLKL